MIPHSDTTLEWDLQRRLGGMHSIHVERLWLAEVSAAAEQRMLDEEVPRAAAYLEGLEPDVVIFGCTSAGALYGPAGEDAFCLELEDRMAAPVLSAFGSVRRTLTQQAGRDTVGIVTPYSRDLHETVLDSLAAAGVVVLDAGCMGLTSDHDIGHITPDTLTRFVRNQFERAPVPQRLFISCTNLRAAEAADELAARLNRPVTSSNLAILDTLRPYLDNPQADHGAEYGPSFRAK